MIDHIANGEIHSDDKYFNYNTGTYYHLLKVLDSQALWHTPVIPVLDWEVETGGSQSQGQS